MSILAILTIYISDFDGGWRIYYNKRFQLVILTIDKWSISESGKPSVICSRFLFFFRFLLGGSCVDLSRARSKIRIYINISFEYAK